MKFVWKVLCSFLPILVMILLSTSCEPPVKITVENQTDKAVRIYVAGNPYFEVLPHSTTKGDTAIIIYTKFFVEALNDNGDIIYSRTFTQSEFVNPKFKVVVTPTEINPYLPLEVDNNSKYPVEVKVNGAYMITNLQPGATIKRRPLPSDVDTYHITVVASTGGAHFVDFKTILDMTYHRTDIENQGRKIVVTDPASQ